MTPPLEPFLEARPRLLRIARRVLVNAADADDIVQDVWVRWQQADRTVVRDPAAFLTTATTRLALNVGQSARARHEACVGDWTADLADTSADPLRGAEQGEALEQALRRLQARLSAAELAVYVLREAFDYPHRRIAGLLGLSEANVRQIVTRARRRVADKPRRPVDPEAHARLLETFLAAANDGSMVALEQLLGADQLACAA